MPCQIFGVSYECVEMNETRFANFFIYTFLDTFLLTLLISKYRLLHYNQRTYHAFMSASFFSFTNFRERRKRRIKKLFDFCFTSSTGSMTSSYIFLCFLCPRWERYTHEMIRSIHIVTRVAFDKWPLSI